MFLNQGTEEKLACEFDGKKKNQWNQCKLVMQRKEKHGKKKANAGLVGRLTAECKWWTVMKSWRCFEERERERRLLVFFFSVVSWLSIRLPGRQREVQCGMIEMTTTGCICANGSGHQSIECRADAVHTSTMAPFPLPFTFSFSYNGLYLHARITNRRTDLDQSSTE